VTAPSEFQVGDYLALALGKLGTSIFDKPQSQAEADIRRHVGLFALDAVDRRKSPQDRLNAVRHMLVCDPVRAVAILVDLAANGFEALDGMAGMRPGAALDAMREMNRMLDEGEDPDSIDLSKYTED
jgi:hypothetical protein